MSKRAERGEYWETVASSHLAKHGLTIIERRYRCRLGEIDIVCRDGDSLVFVEVRARSSSAYTTALGSVSCGKRRRIVNAARHFLMRHPECFDDSLRFDIVAIDGIDTREPRLHWIRNAFDGS